MTFEEWQHEQLTENPKLQRSSRPFLRKMYHEYTKRQQREAHEARVIEDSTQTIRRRLLLLQLAVSFACSLTLGFLDEETHSLWDLIRLENLPALVLYTLVFFGMTMILRGVITAPVEEATGSRGLVG